MILTLLFFLLLSSSGHSNEISFFLVSLLKGRLKNHPVLDSFISPCTRLFSVLLQFFKYISLCITLSTSLALGSGMFLFYWIQECSLLPILLCLWLVLNTHVTCSKSFKHLISFSLIAKYLYGFTLNVFLWCPSYYSILCQWH